MIHKSDLLDPTAVDRLTDYEKSLVDGAQNAGHGPRFINRERVSGRNPAGTLQQFLNPGAIRAAECGAPGCDSDISDGLASLSETFDHEI